MGLFQKVEDTKSGLKVLVFGKTGVGKSTFGLTFPKIAVIDSEDGLAWYKDNPNLEIILNTTSAEDVEDALDEIEDEYLDVISTFIVDSETKVYENMQLSGLSVAEKRARLKGQDVDDANISQREWGKIKLVTKRIQSEKISLASQGKNIVSVAQEKDLKEKKGKDWVIVGHAPDTGKGLEYDYDIIVRLFTEEDDKGNVVYKGKIEKDRTNVTKRGQIVENPSFELWKQVYEGKQGLKEDVKNFKEDIDKDEKKMYSELKSIEDITKELKIGMKDLGVEDQTKVKVKLRELGIDNPLKTDDVDGLEEVVNFMKSL